ncbi:hypothetical protein ACROYT_G022038 [Oculina patagonica]
MYSVIHVRGFGTPNFRKFLIPDIDSYRRLTTPGAFDSSKPSDGRRTEYDPCKSVPQVSSLQENARSDSKTSTTQTSTSDLETNDETPFLSPAERLFKVYDEVETFVMFIGYPHSSHSLVGAILDAHPGIIIPHEYNVLANWAKYQSPELKQKNLQKFVLFYDLHQLSFEQAMFDIRANNSLRTSKSETVYTYNIPGLWQGGYLKKIKINNARELDWAIKSYFGMAAANQRDKERINFTSTLYHCQGRISCY